MIDLLFPKVCILGNSKTEDMFVCRQCRAGFKYIDQNLKIRNGLKQRD